MKFMQRRIAYDFPEILLNIEYRTIKLRCEIRVDVINREMTYVKFTSELHRAARARKFPRRRLDQLSDWQYSHAYLHSAPLCEAVHKLGQTCGDEVTRCVPSRFRERPRVSQHNHCIAHKFKDAIYGSLNLWAFEWNRITIRFKTKSIKVLIQE